MALLERLPPGDTAEDERPCDYHLGRFMAALGQEVPEAVADLEQRVFRAVDWAAFESAPYSLDADHHYNALLMEWLEHWRIYPRNGRALRGLHLGVALTCIGWASELEKLEQRELCRPPWNPAFAPKPSAPFRRARKLRPMAPPKYEPRDNYAAYRVRSSLYYAHEALRRKMEEGRDTYGDTALLLAAREEEAAAGGVPLEVEGYFELEAGLFASEQEGHPPRRLSRFYRWAAWTQCAAGGDYAAAAKHFKINDVTGNIESLEREVRETMAGCGLGRSPVPRSR